MRLITVRSHALGMALVVAAIMIGIGNYPVDAQQPAKMRAPASGIPIPGIRYQASHMNGHRVGDTFVWTMQGNVTITQPAGSSVVLTTGTNELVIDMPKSTYLSAGKTLTSDEQIVHMPMNLATMRVSVTPAGTLFEDQQDDSVLIETKDLSAGN